MINMEEQIKINELVKVIKKDKKFNEELINFFNELETYYDKCLCYRYAVAFNYEVNVVKALVYFKDDELINEIIELINIPAFYKNVEFLKKNLSVENSNKRSFLKKCKQLAVYENVEEELLEKIIKFNLDLKKVENIINNENEDILIPALKKVLNTSEEINKDEDMNLFSEKYKKMLASILNKRENDILLENSLINVKSKYKPNLVILDLDESKESVFLEIAMNDETYVNAYEQLLIALYFSPFKNLHSRKADTFKINTVKKYGLDKPNGRKLLNAYLNERRKEEKVRVKR